MFSKGPAHRNSLLGALNKLQLWFVTQSTCEKSLESPEAAVSSLPCCTPLWSKIAFSCWSRVWRKRCDSALKCPQPQTQQGINHEGIALQTSAWNITQGWDSFYLGGGGLINAAQWNNVSKSADNQGISFVVNFQPDFIWPLLDCRLTQVKLDLITVLRDLRAKPPPSSKYPKYMDIFYIQNQLAQHLFCQHLKYTAHTFLSLAYYQVVITLDLSMNAD